jgi:type II secretory pathway pseudopilin PulG
MAQTIGKEAPVRTPTCRTPTCSRPRSRRAQSCDSCRERSFTLLELLVVITVLSLLSVMVVTRVTGVHNKAAFEQAVSLWEFDDQELRSYSRRHDRPTELRLELGSGDVVRKLSEDDRSDGIRQSLGDRVVVARYLSSTRNTDSGRVNIAYSPQGTSDSFAVKLAGPGGRAGWLLVAGVSGQVTPMERDTEVEDVFEALRPSGVYAH